METPDLKTVRILEDYKTGQIDAGEAAKRLVEAGSCNDGQCADIESQTGSAIIDVSREARAGFPEAIYGASKTPEQICEIFIRLYETSGKALATRCSHAALQMLTEQCPSANVNFSCGLAW
ncbi:MAG TPA: hypothetical protein PLM07_19515, partial [Candidatus Rifleibacterium sp.]|nr:hypothetical protein [Candidatus Rifleibacterium sp.]